MKKIAAAQNQRKCARSDCGKTVYPIEELKCLDKVWHKQCFKCTVCGMTLNMKNYKGYDKMPYCEPHYPKTVASVVSDTPEMRRLAENTKNQSMAKYHEDFEKMKGTKIQVADDPEMQRHLKNMQVQSQAAYHHEVERKEMMEKIRPPLQESIAAKAQITSPHVPVMVDGNQYPTSFEPNGDQNEFSSPYSAKVQQGSTLIYSTDQGGRVVAQQKPVGKIDDYDPLNGQWGSIGSTRPHMPNTKAPPPGNYPPAFQTSPKAPPGIGGGPHRHSGGAPVPTFRATYDYTAADTDEVTFVEGDLIINCQSVDEGWMTGTVKRTNQWGMLPANYVERVN